MTTPLITTENVAEFVKKYYESKQSTIHCSAYTKYQMLFKKEDPPFTDTDLYNVFWAIRLLAETGKYDFDDIEFHVKKNPIFLEINAEDRATCPKQIGLLRYTINRYKRTVDQIRMGSLIGAKL
jgi:hypothetical protein